MGVKSNVQIYHMFSKKKKKKNDENSMVENNVL